LFPEGGADRDRTMAAALQQAPATLRAGLPTAGPGGLSPKPLHERSSTPPGRALDSHSAWYKTSVRSPGLPQCSGPISLGLIMILLGSTVVRWGTRGASGILSVSQPKFRAEPSATE